MTPIASRASMRIGTHCGEGFGLGFGGGMYRERLDRETGMAVNIPTTSRAAYTMSDTPDSPDQPASGAPPRRRSIGPYVAVALLGFAIVVAAQNQRPGARTGRARLIDLIA